MCGIVGEISISTPVDDDRLARMSSVLVHRGPDEGGTFVSDDRRWGVAHRRLCIIDPVGGKQPMRDDTRGLTLVFNGEIYDHDRLRGELSRDGFHFHSTSDTEVVLALYARYGLDFTKHLRGEFALAIFDTRRRKLILVRDRMGIKPLFYMRLGNRFLFASEIKALFQDPSVTRAIDPSGLLGALAVADVPGKTIFQGIRQVRHAHWMSVNLDSLEMQEEPYWDAWRDRRRDLPSAPNQDQTAELVELARQEIDNAVRLRLRADVPVGSYLSGGIDSSLVTASMAQRLDRVTAFGLAFEESARHNEFAYAQAVANKHKNIELHRIPITHPKVIRRLPETVWHMERPFGNLHSVAKLIASQYARQYVPCLLTGDGGDEAFCGYSTHWLQRELQEAHYSLPAIRARLKQMKKEAAGIGGNRYYLSAGLARRCGPETQFLADKLGFRPCDVATGLDAEGKLSALMSADFKDKIASPARTLVEQLADIVPRSADIPHAVLLQYVQLNSSVPEYITTIADRTESAGSVEARMPLFDHKVVELAMGLPLQTKLRGEAEKWVLREAYRDLLPSEVLDRRKQAFLAPPSPFSSPGGQELLAHYLSPRAIKEAGIWSPTKVAALRMARRLFPKNRFINIATTVVMTTQILIDQFILRPPAPSSTPTLVRLDSATSPTPRRTELAPTELAAR